MIPLLLVLYAAVPCVAFLSPQHSIATTVLRITPTAQSFSTPTKRHSSLLRRATINDTTDSSTTQPSRSIPSLDHYDCIISGGGPAGLLTAIMLTQKYGPDYKLAVCEQRSSIPPSPSDDTVWSDVARFYLLGLGHRGQAALEQFGVLDDLINVSVEIQGRRDWAPGQTKVEDGRITPANKDPPSRVLPRDKLVGLLHEHLVKTANVDLLYGYQVKPLDFGTPSDDRVSVQILSCQDVTKGADVTGNEKKTNDDTSSKDSNDKSSYPASQDTEQLCNVENEPVVVTADLLIGADGAARTVASAMETADQERYAQLNPLQKLFAKRPFSITKFTDDNPRVYKSVPIRIPSDWPRNLNYSARSRQSRVILEALPSDNQGNLCALLLMKPDDELAQENCDPDKLRQFFDQEFPQFGALISPEEMARVAQKSPSRLPVFRFAGPRLHLGRRTLVLGDAAHTVKPYYGLGANTALEDVQVLSNILDECQDLNRKDAVPVAVETFSKRRAGDADALVTISRNMDRPGKLFFVNFLLPLILDGMFHKMAPRIFGPNMFGMFQIKGMGFKQIQRKKRLDRALQLACIGTFVALLGLAFHTAICRFCRVIGQSSKVVYLGILLSGLLVTSMRKRFGKSETETSST